MGRSVLSRNLVGIVAICVVAMLALLASENAGRDYSQERAYATTTIHFVPQCAGIVKQDFGVVNGVGRYIPDRETMLRVENDINRCNAQYSK